MVRGTDDSLLASRRRTRGHVAGTRSSRTIEDARLAGSRSCDSPRRSGLRSVGRWHHDRGRRRHRLRTRRGRQLRPRLDADAIAAASPVVVVEVLSPSTQSIDSSDKLADFPGAVDPALPDRANETAGDYSPRPIRYRHHFTRHQYWIGPNGPAWHFHRCRGDIRRNQLTSRRRRDGPACPQAPYPPRIRLQYPEFQS